MVLVSLSFFLSACVTSQSPENLYAERKPLPVPLYKSGASEPEVDADLTKCRVYAAQQVPQNIQLRTSPTYRTPSYTTCNQIGWSTVCNTTGGDTVGGRVSSFDANEDLRESVVSSCLANRGYFSANVPPCPVGTSLESFVGGGGNIFRYPSYTNRTCYLVIGGATFIGNLK